MFIAFEGIDGSGKTTLSKMLFDFLKRRGIKTLLTREPFDENLRKAVLEKPFDPWGETFLFLADRGLHVNTLIKPKLEEGFTVISDRFYLSTLAYQGFGRGLDIDLLKNLNEKATGGLKPDITFLIDVPVEVALERIKNSRKSAERFEKKDFLQKVREGFLELAKEDENIFVLNGEKNLYQLLGEVLERIDRHFRRKASAKLK